MNFRIMTLILFFFAMPPAALAYLDEVLMTPNEIWEAAKTVLETPGIDVENKETYTLKSKWVEDYVRKERTVIPRQVGRGFTLTGTVRRRYQMMIVLKELPSATQIQITGKYQERPVGAPEHQARWKFIKPSTEDYELERQLFFKILREMARIRVSQS